MLILLAVVWRVGYFLDYAAELPFLYAPLYDSLVYLSQAAAIGDGNFDHPALLAFSPLYGWFLAVAGAAAVPLQLGLGVVTLWMIWRAAELTSSPRDALVVMGLWMTYGLLPFYETKILAETLGTTLLVGAVLLWSSRRYREGHLWMGLAAGALLGLATLTRANLLLSLPFFGAAALLPWSAAGERWRVRFRRAAALAVGAALVLAANGSWNYAHTGHFVPVILVSRTASVASSGEWTGDLSMFAKQDGSRASAWDVVEQAREYLDDPSPPETGAPSFDAGGWLRNAPAKLGGTFDDEEPTYQYGYFGERTEVRALDILPTSFGVLLLLGFAGAVALVRRDGWRALIPYLPLVLGVLATTTMFHPSSRYRLPIVVPLAMLAAHAVPMLVDGWRRGLATRLGVIVIVACCLVSAAGTTFYELRHPANWELRVAQGELQRFELRRAVERAERARELAHDEESRRRAEEMIRRIRGR